MQTLTIDLKKNPDIADLTRTMQPGDLVDLHSSIKSMDEQTLTLTVESAEEGHEPEENGPEGDNEGSADESQGDDTTKPGEGMDGAAGDGGGSSAILGGEHAAM